MTSGSSGASYPEFNAEDAKVRPKAAKNTPLRVPLREPLRPLRLISRPFGCGLAALRLRVKNPFRMAELRPILETPRLVLRELALDDLDFVAGMLAHPEVMASWPKPYTRDEAAEWIRRQQERYARDGYGYWLALDKAGGRPIGQAGLLAQIVDGVAETGIGYIIHRPFWRQGYATEAARACRDYAFGKLGKERVVVLVRPENVVSLSVARKLGATPERETVYAGFVHSVWVCKQPPAILTARRRGRNRARRWWRPGRNTRRCRCQKTRCCWRWWKRP